MQNWRERVWVFPLVRRGAAKRLLSHLYKAVLPGLCLPSGQSSVSFFTPDLPCNSPLGDTDGSWSDGFWEEQDSLWPSIIPWLLIHKEPFCMCVVSPLSQNRGWGRSLNPLFKQGFAPLCSCHDYYLKVLTRDKCWLFTLFLLLLPFWRTNRRLIVDVSTGTHLSLDSGNGNRIYIYKYMYIYKCLAKVPLFPMSGLSQ